MTYDLIIFSFLGQWDFLGRINGREFFSRQVFFFGGAHLYVSVCGSELHMVGNIEFA